MISEYKKQFPFTTQKEILDWEAYYIQRQPQTRQELEASVIGFRENVSERGYLLEAELQKMAKWKSRFTSSKLDPNPPGLIEDVTAEAFRLNDDWEKLEKLTDIEGVGESVASVILHLYDEKKYLILDRHALNSIGIDYRTVEYDECFWQDYTDFCRAEAKRFDVEMRTLDRALYKFSESGAALALKIMADETLFLELKRRGYNLSRLRNDEKTTEEKAENWENRNRRDAADVKKNTDRSNLDQSLAELKRDVLGSR